MKHLKLFESLPKVEKSKQNPSFYREISKYDFLDIYTSRIQKFDEEIKIENIGKQVRMKKQNIEKLDVKGKHDIIETDLYKYENLKIKNFTIRQIVRPTNKSLLNKWFKITFVDFYEFEDEWFVIRVFSKIKGIHKTNPINTNNFKNIWNTDGFTVDDSETFWICDQWGGVLELLKSKNIIKTPKLFEGYLDKPTYEKISGDEYRRILYVEEVVNIKSKIFRLIKNRFVPELKSKELKTGRSLIKYHYAKLDPRGLAGEYGIPRKEEYNETRAIMITVPSNIFIWEVEDNWFLVYDQKKYYKCDGTNGLMDLLKELKIVE